MEPLERDLWYWFYASGPGGGLPSFRFVGGVAGPSRKCARLNFNDPDDDPGDPDQQGVEQEEFHIPDEYFDALASEQGAQQIGMPKRRKVGCENVANQDGIPEYRIGDPKRL